MTNTSIANISDTVEGWRVDIVGFLPSDLDPEAFMKSATSALINNPQIFQECTHDSLKRALIKAAQDGLRPDGKEGALVKYYNKDAVWFDDKGQEKKGANEAQWMPMVFGIRKKAREKDGIIIKAEVVYKADQFQVFLGDDDRIEHIPAEMDVDAGPVIASYAIFKQGETVLHREVMRLQDIKNVQNASKSSNSPAWSKWFGEMAKKAAVNRGAKSVPMSEAVHRVIDRDNDHYDMNKTIDGAVAGGGREAVAVNERFSARRGNAGFSSENFSKQIEQGRDDSINFDGASRDREKVQTGRSENTDQRASQQSTAAGGQQREDKAAEVSLARSVFESYSKELARYNSEANVMRGHKEFWKDIEKPTNQNEENLGRFIRDQHIRRATGEIEAAVCAAEITKALDEAFRL